MPCAGCACARALVAAGAAALLVALLLAAPARGYPMQLRAVRRQGPPGPVLGPGPGPGPQGRSARSQAPAYYPDMYVPLRPSATSYLYPDDYPDEDEDYGQEQWFDVAAADPAANAAFLQNLMEANKYGERLDRLGYPAGLPPYPARYVDPRYRDSDDYVFGSVNSGTSSSQGRGGYERAAAPAAYGRYQYRVDQDEDQDERDLHALAKKSRSEEQRLLELESQAQAEAAALLAAALSAGGPGGPGQQRGEQAEQAEQQVEQQARREANQRAEEFSGDVNALAELDQGLERLFAKSGIANAYRAQDEPRPWNGRDPVWNGYYMGNAGSAGDMVPQRPTRSKAAAGSALQHLQAPTTAPAAAASTPTTTTPAPTSTATSTTSAPTPAPIKRMLSAGQMSGQPEVALLRPATSRAGPRGTQRVQRAHQGGVDEIRNLLRVQDTMGARAHAAHADLLSLLPAISKRSAPVVSDEGSLVDELNALKKKSD